MKECCYCEMNHDENCRGFTCKEVGPLLESLKALIKEIETAESMDCFLSYEESVAVLSRWREAIKP